MSELEHIWSSAPVKVENADRRHALILLAQGPDRDDDAVLDLLGHYVGVLRDSVRRFGVLDQEDAKQLALLALLVSVDRYDAANYGVLTRVTGALLDLCWDAVAQGTSTSGWTLRQYQAAVKKSNGNRASALELAKQMGVGADTFKFIEANQHPGSAQTTQVRLFEPSVDAAELTEQALAVLTPLDRRIVRYSYGFVDGVPHDDNETAEYLGSSISTVQRRRSSAILTMRDALGVGPRRSAS